MQYNSKWRLLVVQTVRIVNELVYSGYAICYDMFHMAVKLSLILQQKQDWEYSRSPLIRINSEGKPFGYAENVDNRIFLCK